MQVASQKNFPSTYSGKTLKSELIIEKFLKYYTLSGNVYKTL